MENKKFAVCYTHYYYNENNDVVRQINCREFILARSFEHAERLIYARNIAGMPQEYVPYFIEEIE